MSFRRCLRHKPNRAKHLARAKRELDKQWNGFEAQVQTYFESAGKQIEQQQATFKDIAAAQAEAWRKAAIFLVMAGVSATLVHSRFHPIRCDFVAALPGRER